MRSADRNKTNDGIKERNGQTEGLSINSLISPQLARIMHRNLPSAPSDNCFLKSGRWKTFKKTKNKKTQSHSEEKSMRSFLRNWVSENSTPGSRSSLTSQQAQNRKSNTLFTEKSESM